MLSRTVAVMLCVVLSCTLATNEAVAQTPSDSPGTALAEKIKVQINSTAIGTYLAVRFTDGHKTRGYLTQIGADEFSLRVGDRTNGAETRTKFDEVQSVKAVARTHTPTAAWIATGVLVGVVVAVLVAYLTFLHNEGH
jgi:hypothetical protein